MLEFLNKIINEEQESQITSNYSIVSDALGFFDCIYFCNFKDGTALNDRGPNFLKKAWESESPIVEQCILTDLIVGRFPFNSNNYVNWKTIIEREKTKPVKFETYK